MLYQSGYLSIDSYDKETDASPPLHFPGDEVRQGMVILSGFPDTVAKTTK